MDGEYCYFSHLGSITFIRVHKNLVQKHASYWVRDAKKEGVLYTSPVFAQSRTNWFIPCWITDTHFIGGHRRVRLYKLFVCVCVCVCDNIYSYLFIKFCRLSFLHNSNNSSRLYFSFTEFILSAGGFCTEFVLYGVMKQFLNLYLFLIDPTCK